MSEGFKVVKGAKYQKRPSASYFYKKLKVPVGYIVEYRPRKGGKMIKHSLRLRKNGSPYWKAEEKLPKKKSSKKIETRSVGRTSKNKKRTKQRSKRVQRSINYAIKMKKKRTKKRSSRLRGGARLKQKVNSLFNNIQQGGLKPGG